MKPWWKRYEHILEARPVAAGVALRDLLAKEAAEMCLHFPPPASSIDWVDERLRRKMVERIAFLPAPDEAAVVVIAKLVRWDLEHEIEAIDHFIRNRLHREAFPTADDEIAMQFLWRGILELLAMRKDEAPALLKTHDLIEAAAALPAQFRRLRLLH